MCWDFLCVPKPQHVPYKQVRKKVSLDIFHVFWSSKFVIWRINNCTLFAYTTLFINICTYYDIIHISFLFRFPMIFFISPFPSIISHLRSLLKVFVMLRRSKIIGSVPFFLFFCLSTFLFRFFVTMTKSVGRRNALSALFSVDRASETLVAHKLEDT